jgi:hypothetical protein
MMAPQQSQAIVISINLVSINVHFIIHKLMHDFQQIFSDLEWNLQFYSSLKTLCYVIV